MTTLCQITMNAGEGIPGSVIKWNLKKHSDKFDRVIVVDGNLTERAKEFYSQFKNVEWVDSPWTDSYVSQYEAWKAKLKEGEWALYLDCDEIAPSNLLKFISGDFKCKDKKLISLPCVLHISEDNHKYYPVENKPTADYRGQFVKHILLEKHDDLYFRHFGSHVEPQTRKGLNLYVPEPYYHMKSLESFVYNDVWQAFLSPEGQQYNSVEAACFKLFISKYKTTKEFKEAGANGNWPVPLVKFAWEKRWHVEKPISRLAWTYFLLYGHPFLEEDRNFTWQNVKQFVLGKESMELFEKNKQEGNFIDVSSY